MAKDMSISVNGKSQVPPGFRFHPTEEELLQYYLRKRVSYEKIDLDVIHDVDLNKLEPWDIQENCKIGSTPQSDWYFFSHKDKKYPTGTRTNRATTAGFWKATGRDKVIYSNARRIGMRKTLVFYEGRAPHGHKSDWIMHEYRLDDNIIDFTNSVSDAVGETTQEEGWVVCRIFKKKLLHHKTLDKNNNNNCSSSSSSMNNTNISAMINIVDTTLGVETTLTPKSPISPSTYNQGTLEQIFEHTGRANNYKKQVGDDHEMFPNSMISSQLPPNYYQQIQLQMMLMTTDNYSSMMTNSSSVNNNDWNTLDDDQLVASSQLMINDQITNDNLNNYTPPPFRSLTQQDLHLQQQQQRPSSNRPFNGIQAQEDDNDIDEFDLWSSFNTLSSLCQ